MCQSCPKDTSEATGWTVGILLTLLMAFFTFLGLDLKFGWTRSKGGSRFKPAVNAVQAMTVIYLFPVKWPPMMVKLSKVFEGFSVDVAVLSPSCFGIAFGFYQRFLWSSLFAFTCVLGPFLVSAVVSLIRALFPESCGCWKEERADNGWETTRTFRARYRLAWHVALPVVSIYSMVVVLFVHPTISGQAFFFFRCHEIKDIEPTLLVALGGGNSTTNAAQTTVGYTATSYLVADYSLKCYDGGWNTMLPYALLVVIGFSLGMPLFLMWQLCKHRKVIQEIGRQAMLEDAAKNEEEARNEKPSIGRRAATSIGGGLKALARKASTRVRSLSRSRASPGGARGFDVAPSHTSGEVKIDDGGDGADAASLQDVTVVVDDAGDSDDGAVSIVSPDVAPATEQVDDDGKGNDDDDGGGETKGDALIDDHNAVEEEEVNMQSNPMHATAPANGAANLRGETNNTHNEEEEVNMHSNPMHATTTGAGAAHLVGETNHTHNDPVVDEEINMHSNPMHAAAITAGETAEGKEEHRAADRLGVLYSIYKPECFYFDIINFFHVSLHSPGPQPLLNALSHIHVL